MYDICPNCESEHVAQRLEDAVVVFECRDCDWVELAEHPFHVAAWSVRIRQALAPVDILQSALTHPDAAAFIAHRITGVSHLTNPALPLLGADHGDDYLRGEIDIAHQVYLRQLIVLANTYIELIYTDFFRCVFLAHPLRMHQVLPPHDKGWAEIKLNEIVNSPSREALLATLATRAAERKGDGEADRIARQLTADCSIQLHRPLIDDLRELKELRNRIVHDDTDEEVAVERVHESFGLILYLLFVLAQAAEHYKIPCWDDVGFLADFQDRLSEDHE
jgi:hypothetical protein